MPILTCPICGTEILSRRRSRRTCSNRCRERLYRRRLEAREALAMLEAIPVALRHPTAWRVLVGQAEGMIR
jgi:predicted nucleic acid-binding Zn ribbon protein